MIKNYLESRPEAAWGVSVTTWPHVPGINEPAPEKNLVLIQVEDFGEDSYARRAMEPGAALRLAAALASSIFHCKTSSVGEASHSDGEFVVYTQNSNKIVIELVDMVVRPGTKVIFPMSIEDAHDMISDIGRAAHRILFHVMGRDNPDDMLAGGLHDGA